MGTSSQGADNPYAAALDMSHVLETGTWMVKGGGDLESRRKARCEPRGKDRSLFPWILHIYYGLTFKSREGFLFPFHNMSNTIYRALTNSKGSNIKRQHFNPFPYQLFFNPNRYINIQRYYKPARSTRSIGRCSALGVGLRAWRGERVLGVEAGEFGSAGSSGSG